MSGMGVDARSDAHDAKMAEYAKTPEAIDHALEWFEGVSSAENDELMNDQSMVNDVVAIHLSILDLYLSTGHASELIAEKVEQEFLDGLGD
jgi:hypothetical protein